MRRVRLSQVRRKTTVPAVIANAAQTAYEYQNNGYVKVSI